MHPRCSGPCMNDGRAFEFLVRELFSEHRTSNLCGACGKQGGRGQEFQAFGEFLNGRRIEFHRTREAYFAYVNVPGLDGKSLRIVLQDGVLTVLRAAAGNAAGPSSGGGQEWETLGSYELPEDSLQDGIFARVEDGELFLSIPRIVKDVVEVPIVEVEKAAADEQAPEEKNSEETA